MVVVIVVAALVLTVCVGDRNRHRRNATGRTKHNKRKAARQKKEGQKQAEDHGPGGRRQRNAALASKTNETNERVVANRRVVAAMPSPLPTP